MKKILLSVILVTTLNYANEVKNIPIPKLAKKMTLMSKAIGDLNHDNVSELVLVIDTGEELELGTGRQINIYQQNAGKWKLWHSSKGAVLSSEHGGMMGDPFQSIDIVNNTIVIKHFGGSRDKWTYTHRYRFQNSDWYLIGATIAHFAPCDFEDLYDYNLSTGALNVDELFDISSDNCYNKGKITNFSTNHKISPIKMDGFYPGNNEVKLQTKSHYGSFYY